MEISRKEISRFFSVLGVKLEDDILSANWFFRKCKPVYVVEWKATYVWGLKFNVKNKG